YAIVAVRDANRNRRADPGEAFGVASSPLAVADSAGGEPIMFTLATVDSLAPQPQRARGLSQRRLAVRFNERVRLTSADSAWVVADSASGERVGVTARYVDPISPQEVRLITERPLAPGPWRVELTREGIVADSAGNTVAPFEIIARVAEREDDTTSRFSGFLPESPVAADSAVTLRPEQWPGLAFSTPPEALPEVTVTSGGQPVEFATTSVDNRIVQLDLDPAVRRFTVAVASGDSTLQRQYRRPEARETGEIIGRVVGAGRVVVEARPASGDPYRAVSDSTGAFRIEGLPPGDYRLRFIGDADGDGAWSPGALAPYAPPERLVFASDAQTVRVRFETDIGEIRLDAPPEVELETSPLFQSPPATPEDSAPEAPQRDNG
ncbi:MAG: carboxypeptidase-like regulatory domain-containing protein, partial [Bacteroidota bacterium]